MLLFKWHVTSCTEALTILVDIVHRSTTTRCNPDGPVLVAVAIPGPFAIYLQDRDRRNRRAQGTRRIVICD